MLRMRTAVRSLILVAALASGAWLFLDSFTFGLLAEDPDTGRARGCYTDVELALGLKKPSLIRQVEQLLSAVLLFGVPGSYAFAAFRRRGSAGKRVE